MYLLKILTISVIFYIGYVFFTWVPHLPTTPLDAHRQVKHSYKNNDNQRMARLLCLESIENIKKSIKLISKMPPRSRANFADKMGINESKLLELSVADYIKIQFHLNNKTYIDKISEAFNYQINKIEVQNNIAKIITVNNIELIFKKEGPYWLFMPEYYR